MSGEEGAQPGPSTEPVFKKKRGPRSRLAPTAQVTASSAEEGLTDAVGPKEDDDQDEDLRDNDVSLSDLVALHALRQKPRGIDLDRLNKGQNAKKKKKKKKSQQQAEDGSTGQKTEEDRWQEQMQRGGLVTRGKLNDMTGKKADEGGKGRQASGSDDDDDDEDDDDEDGEEARKKESGPRLVKQNNFQGETGTVDVDKHMMAYIEEEMRKRREEAAAATTTTTSSTVSLASAPTGEAALQSVLSNPEDELYEIAERYRKLQQSAKEAIALAKGKKVQPTLHNGNGAVEPTKEEQREKAEKEAEEEEGNVTLSSTMLTSVPEVDLGMSHRLKNIQETERAKRAMEEARRNRVAQPLEEDDQYAAARFFRHRNTIQSDAEALAAARRDAGMLEDNEEDGVAEENGRTVKKSQSSYYGKKAASQGEQAKRPNFQMASDDAAVERFKKRQRNQLKR